MLDKAIGFYSIQDLENAAESYFGELSKECPFQVHSVILKKKFMGNLDQTREEWKWKTPLDGS